MARKLNVVTPDIGSPDTDRPDGYYLDEDTGVPGSPVLAGEGNSIYYFFSRLMSEVGKAFNGLVDNITTSQFFDALAEFVTGRDSAIATWVSGTYAVNSVIIYGGKQWFVGAASTINTPGFNSEWVKSKSLDEYANEASQGKISEGDLIPLNDLRNADYETYYKMGKFTWNGSNYEAWRVNIDGSSHVSLTSDVAKLLAGYKFQGQVIASDVAGTLTLKDYSGRVKRAIDGSGGDTEDIGDVQADASQGHVHDLSNVIAGSTGGDFTGSDQYHVEAKINISSADRNQNLNGAPYGGVTPSPTQDGTNGTPRTDSETRMKNVSVGALGITVIVAEGTV